MTTVRIARGSREGVCPCALSRGMPSAIGGVEEAEALFPLSSRLG
jgi:hypothetical protein